MTRAEGERAGAERQGAAAEGDRAGVQRRESAAEGDRGGVQRPETAAEGDMAGMERRRTAAERDESPGVHPDQFGRVTYFVPAYGPIEGLMGFGLFYVLVDIGTPVAMEAFARTRIGIDPSVIGTAGAIALWVILGLTVFGQAAEQVRGNPRRFSDREAAGTYLSAMAPSGARLRTWAVLFVVGAAITGFGLQVFLESFEALLEWSIVTVGSADARPVPFRLVGWFVGYSIGFSLFTRYTDRLVLGLYRWRLANRTRADD